MTPIIALLTDFTGYNWYIGVMKGVIMSINSSANIIDLCHDVSSQDVRAGSFVLGNSYSFFPRGTIHVAVVDPGVGTNRHPVAILAGGQILVCPDNGLPTLFLRDHPLEEARIITNPKVMRKTISATFHGRDVFAPAAGRIAQGAALRELGTELDTLVMLDVPLPTRDAGDRVRGEIMHVDRFGNLVTNIDQSLLGDTAKVSIRAGSHRLRGIRRTYAEVAPGALVALFGGSGYLEIAINGGSANAALRLDKGARVTVEG